MSLEELRRKRLRWVEANRENDFEEGIERLLTELYPDNAHFIYEILQNAEDAKATEVRFLLKEDGVEFEHNGSRLFTLEDVKSITSIGDSTKKDDPTNIGKFGVGFKAVFAYTKTPEITSDQYHFRIRDLVVPDTAGLSPYTLGEKETRFSFPFDNPQKPPGNACTEIEKNLRQLDESTLLFLNNIRKIEYLLPDSTLGFLERKETDGNRIEILVQHPEDSESTSIFFLRFEKTVDVKDEYGRPKSCRIAVAFGLEEAQEQKWKIKSLDEGRVCIYFPAEKETSNLRFHLHAPFASTVARDSVRDCPANDELRDHLANLVVESMTVIRDEKLLTTAFLAVLPNDKDNLASLYLPIQEQLVEAFQNQKLVPMKQGGHAVADRIFRGTAQLSTLISDNDLAIIEEKSPPLWIANPQQRNQQEDHFLSLLGILEWKAENLVAALEGMSEGSADVCPEWSETITKWFLEKSDDWLQGLYSFLGDFLSNAPSRPSSVAAERKDKLSKLRIVLCSDGKYRSGDECYFPSDDVERDEDMPRVAKGAYSSGTNKTQQDKTRRFLEDIGVREVGEVERVKAILKQRYVKGTAHSREENHRQDIERFIALVETKPDKKNLFKDYFIFKLENEKWGRPNPHVFLDIPYLDTGLNAYYKVLGEDSGRKRSLSPEYENYGVGLERMGKFARAVGAQVKLEPKKQNIPAEHPEYSHLHSAPGQYRWYTSTDEDYFFSEFETLLNEPSIDKARLLWRTMSSLSPKRLKASCRQNQSNPPHYAASTLVHDLRKTEWVPQRNGGSLFFVRPCDALVKRLPKGFQYEAEQLWLEDIQFGEKAERESEEYKRREQQASDLGIPVRVVDALNALPEEEREEALQAFEGIIKHRKMEVQKRAQGIQKEGNSPYHEALSEAFSKPGKEKVDNNGTGGNGGSSPNPSRRREKGSEEIEAAIENEDAPEERSFLGGVIS